MALGSFLIAITVDAATVTVSVAPKALECSPTIGLAGIKPNMGAGQRHEWRQFKAEREPVLFHDGETIMPPSHTFTSFDRRGPSMEGKTEPIQLRGICHEL